MCGPGCEHSSDNLPQLGVKLEAVQPAERCEAESIKKNKPKQRL